MIWDHVVAALIILTWLGCGYVGGAIEYADFHMPGCPPGWPEYIFGYVVLLLGPIGLLMSAIVAAPFRNGICWNWITKPVLAADPPVAPLSPALANPALAKATVGYRSYIFGTNVLIGTGSRSFGDLPKTEQTEPITGYRVWKLNAEGKLCSAYKDHIIWPPRKKLTSDDFENRGIHAVKDIHRLAGRVLRISVGDYQTTEGLWQEYHADVAGEVYLWGEVKEFELGYTAQYAYPKQLWMPEDSDPLTVMQLEENYGVPVTLRKEFKKSAREVIDDYQAYMAVPPGGWQTVQFAPGQVIPVTAAMSYALSITTPRCTMCGFSNPHNASGLCSSCELKKSADTVSLLMQSPAFNQYLASQGKQWPASLLQKLLPPAPDPQPPQSAEPDPGISGSST